MYLTVSSLEKRYGYHDPSVKNLSFALARGELLGILGPSGCGKTTTLRMISGLVAVTSGKILVDGHDVSTLPPYRRNMGVMFQSYALFPHLTIAQNVAFGLEMRKLPKQEIAKRVASALEMVRLDNVGSRRPRELSGGQQQRVALARALVIEPDILLLDEPLSNLDAKLRDDMRSEIRDIQQQLQITAIFVTHDQTEAMAICDRIVVMNKGQLEQIGTPLAIYEQPATPMVADFVGRINRLGGIWQDKETVAVGDHLIRTRISDPDVSRGDVSGVHISGIHGKRALVMVRPHRIIMRKRQDQSQLRAMIDAEVNQLSGYVREAIFIGDTLQYKVETGGGMVLVEQATLSGGDLFHQGDEVSLLWQVGDTLVFDEGQGDEGQRGEGKGA